MSPSASHRRLAWAVGALSALSLVSTVGTTAALPRPAVAAPAVAAPAVVRPAAAAAAVEQQVLVLKYFPLASDGVTIDQTVTGDVSGTLAELRQRTDDVTATVADSLSRGTRYHGYANPSAPPSITYRIVDKVEKDTAVPSVANPNYNPPGDVYQRRPDYPAIAAGVDICSYVRGRGVDEVWMFAYQGPSQLQIDESKMGGPHGDHSNSWVHGELPDCGRTYTLYTFNEALDAGYAVHSYGHQLESELGYLDQHTFVDLFEGPPYPAGSAAPGRCGSVHNPPNSQEEYDYADPKPHGTDCPQWQPDGSGLTSNVNCDSWGCTDRGPTDNPQLNYLVWWMQNFPGAGNQVSLAGRPMRNWWEIHTDFDAAVESGTGLAQPPVAGAAPAAAVLDGQQHVFAVSGNRLGHWWADQGQAWRREIVPGGTATGVPAVYGISDQQQVFARAADGRLSHWWFSPGAGWHYETLTDSVAGNPSAFVFGTQQHVFVRDTDGHLSHWWYNSGGPWNHEVISSQVLAGDPVGFAYGATQQHVFARTSGGRIAHWWYNPGNPWRTETFTQATVTDNPAAFVFGAQEHLFARNSAGRLSHWWFNPGGSWNYEVLPAGTLAGSPAGYSYQNTQEQVFARTAGGQLAHWWYDPGGSWHTETFGQAAVADSPAGFTDADQQHAFARDGTGHLAHWWRNPGQDWQYEKIS